MLVLGVLIGVVAGYGLFMTAFFAGTYEVYKTGIGGSDPLKPLPFMKKKASAKRKPKVHDDYDAWVAEQQEAESRERV